MYPSIPVLMICRRVLLFNVLPDVSSLKIYFAAVFSRDCGGSIIEAILGFIVGGKTETYPMVRQLNNFRSKIPLLVQVHVSRLLVRSPCASLMVAVFNSYPEFFIVGLLIVLTSLSNLSIFSLVNIAFEISLCELDAWLNTSAVTLLASVIDSSLSYLVTF